VPEGSPLALRVHAADLDGDAIGLTANASGLPPGSTFTPDPGDTTGTLAWTPGYDDAGSYTVAFTAANALTATTSTTITVSNVDRAPTVTVPAAVSTPEAGPLTVMVHAADPDGQPLGMLNATGLPAGAKFVAGPGNTAGTLSWTPTLTQAGSYKVTFTAANALSGTASTVLTVSNTDRAPLIAAPATVSGPEASPLTVTVQVMDPDARTVNSLTRGYRVPGEDAGEAIASLTADVSGLPAGATFTPGPGNTTGTLRWTPSFTQAGSYTVTFTAANALSRSVRTVITVTNVDRSPMITAPATVSVPEAGTLAVKVHVTDPDGQAANSLTRTDDVDGEAITLLTADLSGLPPGATFTPDPGNKSGTLAWRPGYDDAGSYTVAFTAPTRCPQRPAPRSP
jgi:PKD repeat protein